LKNLLLLVLALFLFGPWASLAADPAAAQAPQRQAQEAGAANTAGAGPDRYVRGAHWFGDAWAVNFWNTRLAGRAARDFEQIRRDGFNTVVLVVPWPGFVASATDGDIDPDRARRLLQLIDLAGEAGLAVVLRLGFVWDSSVEDSYGWLLRLWTENDVLQAWVEHLGELWRLVKARPNVLFGFVSWEDLWVIYHHATDDAPNRLALAADTGFRAWLRKRHTLESVGEHFGATFADWDQVPIPHRMDPAFGLLLEFIDHAWIERFFKPAQAVFPRLSMEVRIDADPVWRAPGELAYWHEHDSAWDLPGAPWTVVYWSPAMGGENRGETLTPDVAAERLAYQMGRLRAVTGGRPIFISQFLVEDFTPGYELSGRIPREQVGDFLEAAAPVLRKLTHGYAVWAWRDYRHDAVPSPDFSLAGAGWEGLGHAGRRGDGYELRAGERFQRVFESHQFHAPGGPEFATLCVSAAADGNPEADLRISADTGVEPEELDATGAGRACARVAVESRFSLALEALVDISLQSVTLSGFTQTAGLRDASGAPKPIAAAWRELNAALQFPDPAPYDAFADGWMGKTLTARLRADGESGAATLRFRTSLPESWPFQPAVSVDVNGVRLGTVPCTAAGQYALDFVPAADRAQQVMLTVDRTHRPAGDQRRLGCVISGLQLVTAGDAQNPAD
jgi:hypothetical protein